MGIIAVSISSAISVMPGVRVIVVKLVVIPTQFPVIGLVIPAVVKTLLMSLFMLLGLIPM
jgi:hypothetical protein